MEPRYTARVHENLNIVWDTKCQAACFGYKFITAEEAEKQAEKLENLYRSVHPSKT